MLKTINQIKKEFEEIAIAHEQINDFFFGNFLEAYEDRVIKHCFLLVDVLTATPVNIRGAGSYVDLQIMITVADIVTERTQDNYVDVKSDTLLIITDIINTFETERWTSFSKVQGSPVATFFRQRGGDLVDGWAVPLTLRIVSVRDLCAIPYNNYDTGANRVSTCQGVTIFKDDIYEQTVASGGRFDYSSGSVCPDASVVNSDATYSQDVPAGGTLILPDTVVNVFVNGVLNQSISVVTLGTSEEINIYP